MNQVGKLIVAVGLLLALVGVLAILAGRISLPLGRLPGDFAYRGKHVSFYFPLATCILISVVITLVLYILSRFRG